MKAALVAAFMAAAPPGPYQATVINVVDGDTIKVRVGAWAGTPFELWSLRIVGIDTPEVRKPPAKCAAEVALGKRASAFAKSLVLPGVPVIFTLQGFDKYGGRLDATLTLADGRDYAGLMLSSGYAAPYTGIGPKRKWCAHG